MSARLERALLLHQQGRHELAEKEVRLALADDPDNAMAHALLAQCLSEMKQHAAAIEEARRAIACGPDFPFAHYTLAYTYYQRNYFEEAEAALQEAILLDPMQPDHFALLAAIVAERGDWTESLHAAERGLSFDPDHESCRNRRVIALMKLGREAEAGDAAQDALAQNPDNALTHATRGWGLLYEGEPRKALEHFRESLRLDPTLEYARIGMIEAMKARYWLYRQVLGYFLWLSQLSAQVRWGLMLGLLFLQRVVATIANDNPGLQPVLDPLLIAYVAFVLTTWTAVPLSNLFLRLNQFGRLALSPEERRASNWIGLFVVLALCGVGWALVDGTYGFLGWPIALGFMLLLIPISGTCACEAGWPRNVMLLYTIAMVAVMIAAVSLIVVGVRLDGWDPATAVICVGIALALLKGNMWATLGASLLANWLAGIRPRL